MIEVSSEQYSKDLEEFKQKHIQGNHKITKDTRYVEDTAFTYYYSTDGAVFSVKTSPEEELVEAHAHGETFYVPITFNATEYSSSDMNERKVCYQKRF